MSMRSRRRTARAAEAEFESIIRFPPRPRVRGAGGRHLSVSYGNPTDHKATSPEAAERELVRTLFDLGRQVTSVLDFDDLLEQIPQLIGRLISFEAFAVYLLDERRAEVRAAYMVGYPERDTPFRLALGQGLVGAAVSSEQPLLVNDLDADPRYVGYVPDMHSAVVVPLLHKSKPIG